MSTQEFYPWKTWKILDWKREIVVLSSLLIKRAEMQRIWYQWPAGGDNAERIQFSNNLWSTVDCRCSQRPELGGVTRTRTHVLLIQCSTLQRHLCKAGPPKMIPPGGLPYISHIGMCRPKGSGFCGVLVWKRDGIDFVHFGLESGIRFSRELRECMSVFIVSNLNVFE